MNRYAKENLSTKQSPSGEETRIPLAHGDQERQSRDSAPPGKRTQAINAASLLRFGLPKDSRLRKSTEFRRVYAEGKRFDGRFMTVFVLPSKTESHKLGITASKKGIGKAFERNRAKRLLREAFRLSRAELNELKGRYEWVLNARRKLLHVKLDEPLEDFRQIVETIKNSESELNQGERNAAVGEVQKR